MKTIVGLVGITLMGIGLGVIAFGIKIGLCLGVTLLGLGLAIDAIKENKENG